MVYQNLLKSPIDIEIARHIESNIPVELKQNIVIFGNCLGNCVFIGFWSNLHIPRTYKENSRHYFQIMLDTDPRYQGLGTLDFHRCYNTPKMRGVKKPTEAIKLANKVSQFIKDNSANLIRFIAEERV